MSINTITDNGYNENKLGIEFLNKKIYDISEKLFKISEEKKYISSTLNLAMLYHQTQKYELAETYCLKFISDYNNTNINLNLNLNLNLNKNIYLGKAFNLLGNIYYNLKEYNLSREYYFKSIDKEYYESYYSLGCIYCKLFDYNNAIKYYSLSIDNNFHNSYRNLGIIYDILNNYKMSKKMYKLAIQHNNEIALLNLGNLYVKYHKYNKAEKCYMKLIKTNNELGIDKLELLNKKRTYYLLSDIENKNENVENKLKKIKLEHPYLHCGNILYTIYK